jgi:hypothetical protein
MGMIELIQFFRAHKRLNTMAVMEEGYFKLLIGRHNAGNTHFLMDLMRNLKLIDYSVEISVNFLWLDPAGKFHLL